MEVPEFHLSLRGELGFLRNAEFADRLAACLAGLIPSPHVLDMVVKRIIRHDYRLAADFLNAVSSGDRLRVGILLGDANNLDMAILDSMRFGRGRTELHKARPLISYVDSVAQLDFSDPVQACVFDARERGWLDLFIDNDICSGDGLRHLLDFPAHNYLVRRGLVKMAHGPGGRKTVIKFQNPAKRSRLINEQSAQIELSARTGLTTQPMELNVAGRAISVGLLKYIGVVAVQEAERLFAITGRVDHPTLEDILLAESDPAKRGSHLSAVREILDWLYSHGVIWGDCAPRNIIVAENESGRTHYTILDFEKTTFCAGPVPLEARIEHARRAMCIEEFGAICYRHEVENCFVGYFEPQRWDCRSTMLLDSGKNFKPEFIDILHMRGEAPVTRGSYDQLELDVMAIRFPFVNKISGDISYPTLIGFRVDHYFGAVYDRMVTEIMLYAHSRDRMAFCAMLLLNALDHLDADMLMEDFASIAKGHPSSLQIATDFASGKQIVERLKELRSLIGCGVEFEAALSRTASSNSNPYGDRPDDGYESWGLNEKELRDFTTM